MTIIIPERGTIRNHKDGSGQGVYYYGKNAKEGDIIQYGENRYELRQGKWGLMLYDPSGKYPTTHTPKDYISKDYQGKPQPPRTNPDGTINPQGSPTGINPRSNASEVAQIGQTGIKVSSKDSLTGGGLTNDTGINTMTEQGTRVTSTQQGQLPAGEQVVITQASKKETAGELLNELKDKPFEPGRLHSPDYNNQFLNKPVEDLQSLPASLQTGVYYDNQGHAVYVREGTQLPPGEVVPAIFQEQGAPAPATTIATSTVNRETSLIFKHEGILPEWSIKEPIWIQNIRGSQPYEPHETITVTQQTITAPNKASAQFAGLPDKGTYTITQQTTETNPRYSITERENKNIIALSQEPIFPNGKPQLLNGQSLIVAEAKGAVYAGSVAAAIGKDISNYGEQLTTPRTVERTSNLNQPITTYLSTNLQYQGQRQVNVPGKTINVLGGTIAGIGKTFSEEPGEALTTTAIGAAVETSIGAYQLAKATRIRLVNEEAKTLTATAKIVSPTPEPILTITGRIVSPTPEPILTITGRLTSETPTPLLTATAKIVSKEPTTYTIPITYNKVLPNINPTTAIIGGAIIGGTAYEISQAPTTEQKGEVIGQTLANIGLFTIGQQAGRGITTLGRNTLEGINKQQTENYLNKRFGGGQLITQDTIQELKLIQKQGVDKYLDLKDAKAAYENKINKLQEQKTYTLNKNPTADTSTIDNKISQTKNSYQRTIANIENHYTKIESTYQNKGRALTTTERQPTLNIATRELQADTRRITVREELGKTEMTSQQERKLGTIEVKTPEELSQPSDLYEAIQVSRARSITGRTSQTPGTTTSFTTEPGTSQPTINTETTGALEEGSIINLRISQPTAKIVGTTSLARLQANEPNPNIVEQTIPSNIPQGLRRLTVIEQITFYRPLVESNSRALRPIGEEPIPESDAPLKIGFEQRKIGSTATKKELEEVRRFGKGQEPVVKILETPERTVYEQGKERLVINKATREFGILEHTTPRERAIVSTGTLPEAPYIIEQIKVKPKTTTTPPSTIKPGTKEIETSSGTILLQETIQETITPTIQETKTINILKNEPIQEPKKPRQEQQTSTINEPIINTIIEPQYDLLKEPYTKPGQGQKLNLLLGRQQNQGRTTTSTNTKNNTVSPLTFETISDTTTTPAHTTIQENTQLTSQIQRTTSRNKLFIPLRNQKDKTTEPTTEITTPRIIIPFSNPKKKGLTPTFNVEIRRQGLFKQVNAKGLQLEEAVQLGERITENTLAASFKITTENKRPITGFEKARAENLINRQEFSFSKQSPDVFVQQRSYRLGTSGERTELQLSKKSVFHTPKNNNPFFTKGILGGK